jgi:hypothetical protein
MVTMNNLLDGAGPNGATFSVVTIGAARQFPTKTGSMYDAHNVELRTTSNGQIYEVRLFPDFIRKNNVVPGSTVKGVSGKYASPPSKFPTWSVPITGEQVLSQPRQSNYKSVQVEREMKTMMDEDKVRQIMISLAGLTQAHISAGRTNVEALELAVEARDMILREAISLAQK